MIELSGNANTRRNLPATILWECPCTLSASKGLSLSKWPFTLSLSKEVLFEWRKGFDKLSLNRVQMPRDLEALEQWFTPR